METSLFFVDLRRKFFSEPRILRKVRLTSPSLGGYLMCSKLCVPYCRSISMYLKSKTCLAKYVLGNLVCEESSYHDLTGRKNESKTHVTPSVHKQKFFKIKNPLCGGAVHTIYMLRRYNFV